MITDRQFNLLRAIISEYLETACPVGSIEISEKYNLKCSPATIRNEMAHLIDEGFLEMLHTSSGRVPTRMAYRLYIDQMMEEEDLPVLQEVAMKQRLWSNRFDFGRLLWESTLALADSTESLAIAMTSDGYITHAGAVNVLKHKEFWDIEVARSALALLDGYDVLEKLFASIPFSTNRDIKLLIGEEMGIEKLRECSLAFTEYDNGKKKGYIAVMGPSRLNYSKVIPTLRYVKKLLEELSSGW